MDAKDWQTLRKFSGINNVSKETNLPLAIVDHEYVYPLTQANNVLIDNDYRISSRSGYTSVKTGSDIHSLWSDNKAFFYVDGSTFYKMDEVYNLITIRSDLTKKARISYVKFNDRYYYMNEYEKGYINKDVDNSFTDCSSRNFKEPLPSGQIIEVFMGCLYVACGKTLYIGDPLCDYYDIRYGYRIFNSRITLLRAVDDGIYISDDRVWFCKGKSNEDFELEEVYPSPAVPYTDVRISGKYVDSGLNGEVAIWTSRNGICLGENSGVVHNLTEARYTFIERGSGSGFIKESSNVRHYINSLY